MPQQLWLLRHGDAEPHGSRPDAERRLTGKGERQSRLAEEAALRDPSLAWGDARSLKRRAAGVSFEALHRAVWGAR